MAGLVQELPKPDLPVQAGAPSRFPYLFGLVGGEGSKTSESKVESKIESISDWQRHTSGTPDTSASIHRPRLETISATKPPKMPAQSQEEMLSENAMNSLINKYDANESTLPSSLSESQPVSLIPNNAGKAWNWFRKAGTLVNGASTFNATTDSSKDDILPLNNRDPNTAKTGIMQNSNALQLHELPRRPSKDDMQSHRHTLSKQREIQKPETAQITEEIETLLQSGHSPPGEQPQPEQTKHLPLSANGPTGTARTSEIWGPGSLVLDDGISDCSTAFNDAQVSKRPPWWAKPVDAFDEKNRRKLGLKPLHLMTNGTSDIGDGLPGDRGSSSERNQDNSHTKHPASIATAPKDKQIQSGKISPGAPLAGQRRTRNSRLDPIKKEDNNSRPLPADIPESPFSSRRFTRLDTMRMGHRPAQSRGMIPHDAVLDEHLSRGVETDYSEPKKSDPPRMRAVVDDTLPSGRIKEARPAVQPACSDKSENTPSKRTRQATVPVKDAVASRRSPGKFCPFKSVPRRSQLTFSRAKGTDIKTAVPVATHPHVRPVPVSRTSSQQSGTFAAAAMAARRHITREDSNYSDQRAHHQDRHITSNDRRPVKQRTSLSSLKDFVPANLPNEGGLQAKTDEDEETTVVNVQRLVLGPMDLSSPNRKGWTLVLKAKLGLSQLSLEWQPEAKVVLNLPFDAIGGLQVGVRCNST